MNSPVQYSTGIMEKTVGGAHISDGVSTEGTDGTDNTVNIEGMEGTEGTEDAAHGSTDEFTELVEEVALELRDYLKDSGDVRISKVDVIDIAAEEYSAEIAIYESADLVADDNAIVKYEQVNSAGGSGAGVDEENDNTVEVRYAEQEGDNDSAPETVTDSLRGVFDGNYDGVNYSSVVYENEDDSVEDIEVIVTKYVVDFTKSNFYNSEEVAGSVYANNAHTISAELKKILG